MTDWHRFSIRHSTTSRPEVGNWQFLDTGRLPEGWLGGVMGPEVGHLTDSCERLLNLYAANALKIGGTFFCHQNIHKWTWHSPDQRTANQIDHICIQMMIIITEDVRVLRKT